MHFQKIEKLKEKLSDNLEAKICRFFHLLAQFFFATSCLSHVLPNELRLKILGN